MSEELECAKRLILIILSSGCSPEALSDIYDIRSGDQEALTKHIEALRNIFNKAYDEITQKDENK